MLGRLVRTRYDQYCTLRTPEGPCISEFDLAEKVPWCRRLPVWLGFRVSYCEYDEELLLICEK